MLLQAWFQLDIVLQLYYYVCVHLFWFGAYVGLWDTLAHWQGGIFIAVAGVLLPFIQELRGKDVVDCVGGTVEICFALSLPDLPVLLFLCLQTGQYFLGDGSCIGLFVGVCHFRAWLRHAVICCFHQMIQLYRNKLY